MLELSLITGALAVVLYWVLVGIVVCVGLKTDDPERRKAAMAMLRILKPGSKRLSLPRKPSGGSS